MPSIDPEVWAEFQRGFNGNQIEATIIGGLILLAVIVVGWVWFYHWQGLNRIEYNDLVSVRSGFHRGRIGRVVKMCWFGCIGYYVLRDKNDNRFTCAGARLKVNKIVRKVKDRDIT